MAKTAKNVEQVVEVKAIPFAEHFNPQTGSYSGAFWPRYAAQCCGQCNHTGH